MFKNNTKVNVIIDNGQHNGTINGKKTADHKYCIQLQNGHNLSNTYQQDHVYLGWYDDPITQDGTIEVTDAEMDEMAKEMAEMETGMFSSPS